MTTYIRKPIEPVEAIQWDGSEPSTEAVFQFLGASEFGYSVTTPPDGPRTIALYTDKVRLVGQVGDWMVKAPADPPLFFIVPAAEFALSYEVQA